MDKFVGLLQSKNLSFLINRHLTVFFFLSFWSAHIRFSFCRNYLLKTFRNPIVGWTVFCILVGLLSLRQIFHSILNFIDIFVNLVPSCIHVCLKHLLMHVKQLTANNHLLNRKIIYKIISTLSFKLERHSCQFIYLKKI